jgi:hypothetical protein
MAPLLPERGRWGSISPQAAATTSTVLNLVGNRYTF